MQKKIPPILATALLAGFLIGYAVFETVPSDSFVITGTRETEAVAAVYNRPEMGKIDINTAPAAELADLPGIGPALSARIVAYREEHGPFPNVESLRGVRGIGEKRFETIKDLVWAGD